MRSILLALYLLVGVSNSARSAATIEIPFEGNIPDEVRDEVKKAFKFLQDIELTETTPLHKEFFGQEKTGQAYVDTFIKRVKKITYYSGKVPRGAVALVRSTDRDTVLITEQFANLDLPFIVPIIAMIHESRHASRDGDRWAHKECPDNDLNGELLTGLLTGTPMGGKRYCDTFLKGSYGYAAVIFNNVGRFCANCTDDFKAEALKWANDSARKVVDSESFKKLTEDMSN